MRIRIKTTNFRQNEASKALAEEKLALPVRKLLSKQDREMDIVLDVEFAKITKHHNEGKIWKCEANLDLPHRNQILRAESFGESLEEAVNLVKYELMREIRKYKEKQTAKIRKGARQTKNRQ